MSSGCGDVLSLEDLKTAKKHQLFEAEVITGKQGGVSTGVDIDYATNQVTGQSQKTMPAILRDLGFTPASFNFTTGGTLGVNDADKAVLWPIPGGGDGNYYAWRGALPKTIPASSTPNSTGGLSASAWEPVGDITLRADLARSGTGMGAAGDKQIGSSHSSGTVFDDYAVKTGVFPLKNIYPTMTNAEINTILRPEGEYFLMRGTTSQRRHQKPLNSVRTPKYFSIQMQS